MKKTLFFSVLILVLTSCKNEKETLQADIATFEENKVNENLFKIILNVTVLKDDSFQVFFKEDNDRLSPFEEKNSLFTEIKGNTQPQDIVFYLPEGVFPTQLRLDFGTNKEQSEILVNNFKMTFMEKSFEAKYSNFFDYFIVNEVVVKVDKIKSKAIPFVTKEGAYDPMFYSSEVLDQEILKLAK